MPREAKAMLIDRPPLTLAMRGSGSRSYTVTLNPRFASRIANKLPANPAPMMLTPAAAFRLKQFP
jgi:hypothetical protein